MEEKRHVKCICPFCEEELKSGCFEPIFCQFCKVEFVICRNCNQMFNKKLTRCPQCGIENE